MSAAPSPSGPDAGRPTSPLTRALGIVIMAVPTAGLLMHIAFYGLLETEMLKAYVQGPWLKASAILAFVNLVTGWFHYRKTRMGLDIASRIMTYLWVISMVLLFKAVLPAS